MAIVETASGKVEGFEKRGVLQFRGIPYAAPPVGDRRWRAPEPPEPWSETLEAQAFGPVVPQNASMFHQAMGADVAPMDESGCLNLNVWTPAADDAERPVMLWLHGGAYVMGDGRTPFYDGVHLARDRDVVVVTCNYRIGLLGYLHLGDLDPDFAGSGNAGLLDQIAVLRWVQENIQGFGGDPGNVTLFGESAGAFSTGTLLGTPAASGLFHKAILQSGACEHVHDAGTATDAALEVLAELGIPRSRAAELRQVPIDRLLEAQSVVMSRRWGGTGAGIKIPFQPVVDGMALPRHPLEAVRDGAVAGVPIVAGCTKEELKLFTTFDPEISSLGEEGLHEKAAAALGPDALDVVDAFRAHLGDLALPDLWQELLTSRVFRLPCLHLLEAQQPHQSHTFAYEFAWKSRAWDGMLGASHAMDIPFTFDNLDSPGASILVGDVEDDMRDLARACGDAWTSFAHTGRPEADGLPDWPAWSPDRPATMILDTPPTLAEDPWAFTRQVWE